MGFFEFYIRNSSRDTLIQKEIKVITSLIIIRLLHYKASGTAFSYQAYHLTNSMTTLLKVIVSGYC